KYNNVKIKIRQLLPNIKIHHTTNCLNNFEEYIIPFIIMNREIKEKGMKAFNVFPIRNSCIPHYLRIDSQILIHLFISSKYGIEIRENMTELYRKNKNFTLDNNNNNNNNDNNKIDYRINNKPI